MISMESAPRDGTRIMVKCVVMLFDRKRWKYVDSGTCWRECWFDGKEWQPWSGNHRTTSTGSLPDRGDRVLGWAPVDTLERYPAEREFPELLTEEERAKLLLIAETLWRDLEGNELGGLGGINRPFYILLKFKEVIEEFGRRDVGLTWSKLALDAHPDNKKGE